MNVYAESNFVLELAFAQEQREACEQILKLCEEGRARLVLPAYALAEPYETLTRRHKSRKKLKEDLDVELKQLARTPSYATQIRGFTSTVDLLVKSAEEEANRLEQVRDRLLATADIVPLDIEILRSATRCQQTYDLSPQDAVVCASVLHHLEQHRPESSCFLNKNSRDFDNPDIVDVLNRHNCKMLASFARGHDVILHAVIG